MLYNCKRFIFLITRLTADQRNGIVYLVFKRLRKIFRVTLTFFLNVDTFYIVSEFEKPKVIIIHTI